jgi:hypothetical protein
LARAALRLLNQISTAALLGFMIMEFDMKVTVLKVV